jgi:hypothetical protein
MRDPGLAVRGGDRRVHVVLDARVTRQLRLALSLLLLALDAGLPGVLDGEDAPGPVHRLAKRRLVVEVPGNHLYALFLQRARFLTFRLAGHRAEAVATTGQQLAGDGAPLVSRGSGDENGLHRVGHLSSPFD